MNLATVIVLLGVAALVFVAIRTLRKDKKNCSSCCSYCNSCKHCPHKQS
ncbi:MAG: FeoB-associated Cys-rich membrane protein [Bacteroidales bacterium]|nr:FeoB-associated Cys-rich membrane protein [Bacteroidales bacterium]